MPRKVVRTIFLGPADCKQESRTCSLFGAAEVLMSEPKDLHVVRCVAAFWNKRTADEIHHRGAVLLVCAGPDSDDALRRPRFRLAFLKHFGLGIERIAGEDRSGEVNLLPAEV